MAIQAGHLLLNRRRLVIPGSAVNFPVNTLLQQSSLAFNPDPPLGGVDPLDVPPGIASRVMVVPLPPIDAWAGITIKEPVLDPVTNTVRVDFSNANAFAVELVVLFWDPHTGICPLNADTYGGPCPNIDFFAVDSQASTQA